ncbi:helix-turn-helix domain-containing protein [Pseudahrensia aquimaris]|uniref:Helix-turn-helix domain-containing protein n=1 Tax=Pseudahrensia aquimaris TaxID=744461 RepID=A0ABW3FJA1_9HYPH
MVTRRGIKNSENWTPLGIYLRDKRAALGISQKEMAAGIGVSSAYLSALEHGKRGKPSFALLQRIIGYLGVIWDEAEAVERLAQLSDPKAVIDTSDLSDKATLLACLIAEDIAHWDEETIERLTQALPKT